MEGVSFEFSNKFRASVVKVILTIDKRLKTCKIEGFTCVYKKKIQKKG